MTYGGHVGDVTIGQEREQSTPSMNEQRLGRLTRSGHPLAIIAARMRVLPSAKQDLL